MKVTRFFTLMAIASLSLLVGCETTPEKSAMGSVSTVCKDPRMQMCTRDYTPVCGVDKLGALKTYSNGCTACSYEYVVGHNPGPCETDSVKKQP